VTFEASASGARVHVLDSANPSHAGRLLLRASPEDEPGIQRALAAWLRARLALLAAHWLPEIAVRMQTDYRGVRVARQRTRWGSCSRRGTIGLNCCLLFQRWQVLRYLLVHELAHRSHMNHGPRFWAHVERYEPEFRALDRELSQGWRQVPLWLLKRHPPLEGRGAR
jgi:predicted metal-dependent hydrolase